MKFQSEITVVGMKRSKGELDSGQKYDSTKVYYLLGMDTSKGDAKGQSVADAKIGTYEEYAKYEHLPFPFVAMGEFEMVTTGTSVRQNLVSLTPKDLPKNGGK